jgi:hypothetical protein
MAAIAAMLALAPPAAADGGFFIAESSAATGRLIEQPRQEALLIQYGGEVTVVVRTAYEGDVGELAWVYPVPAVPAKVWKAEDVMFEQLDAETAPTFLIPRPGGKPCLFACGGAGLSMEKAAINRPAVRVEASGVAGMYEWKCLASEGADALLDWLAEHRYAVSPKARKALAHYIRRRMHFLAFRVRAERRGDGPTDIHPVAFRYRSAAVVYPMVISAPTAARQTEVLLYVVGPRPVAVRDFARVVIGNGELAYDPDSATLTDYDRVLLRHLREAGGRGVCHEAVIELASGAEQSLLDTLRPVLRPAGQRSANRWLTRLRTILTPEAMDRDFVLNPVTDEPEHFRTRYYLSTTGGRDGAAHLAKVGIHFAAIAVGAVVAIELLSRRTKRWWHRAGAAAAVLGAVILLAAL